MSEHKISLNWKRIGESFDYETYNRGHEIEFEGKQKIQASAAPDFKGEAESANPEELFVASIASCHMLTFLAMACKFKLNVKSYSDRATAHLEKNEEGMMAVTRVDLCPKVEFEEAVDTEKLQQIHEKAHKYCMIANSVKCSVTVKDN